LQYLQQTAQRTHEFKELTQKDQDLSKDIEMKRKKIDALQTSIQQWRAKMRHLTRETEERNRLLLEEKHSIQKHYQQLKLRIQTYRGTQTSRLLQLSQSASTCKSVLSEKLELARRILQLAELSRKQETTNEQILPFAPPEVAEPGGINGFLPSQDANAPVPVLYQSSVWADPESTTFVAYEDRLWHFQRRYNRVLLESLALDKESDRLLSENQQLEDLILQYNEGTTLTDEVLCDDNPLFVVNGRANLNHAPRVRQIKPTTQDAIQILNTVALQQHAR